MTYLNAHSYSDTVVIRALARVETRPPSAEQIATAPESLLRLCHAGPRQVADLYPWGARRLFRPRMVRALVRELVEREQLAASDPVGLADWSWVWHPRTATGPGTPPPIDLSEVPDPDEAEEASAEPSDNDGEDDDADQPEVEEETPTAGQRRRRRDQERSARSREVRPSTINVLRLPLVERHRMREEAADHPGGRPQTRAECADVPRPCPYVSCRYNLFLDVGDAGNIKLNFPDLEPGEMVESCALDVADRGEVTLEQAGDLLNVTRERARQIETLGVMRMVASAEVASIDLRAMVEGDGDGEAKVGLVNNRNVARLERHEPTSRHRVLLEKIGDDSWHVNDLIERAEREQWGFSGSYVRVLLAECLARKLLTKRTENGKAYYQAARREAAE